MQTASTGSVSSAPFGQSQAPSHRTMQKVVVVNGATDSGPLLDAVLSGRDYDIVFVESSAHAYSQIKRVQPDLVILCLRLEDADGFQVLSMLKIDEATRRIPLVTYTADDDPPASQEQREETDEEEGDTEEALFGSSPAARMN